MKRSTKGKPPNVRREIYKKYKTKTKQIKQDYKGRLIERTIANII